MSDEIMTAPLYTINAVSELLEKDRRLITRVLRKIPPDSKAAGKQTWRLPTVVNALIADAESRGVDATSDLTTARTRQAVAKASQAEFDLAVEQGEWCRTNDAVEYMIAIIIVIRERLLTLSGELQGMLDAEQGELADNRIRDALTELATPKAFMKMSTKYRAEDRAREERKKLKGEGDIADV